MKPVVSIVTVVFNGEAELESTIRSVIGQTYFPQIEYIIIDGGSTDGTTSIIKRYEQYITRWVSEPDKGIYDAMNKAVGMARGEWINFMNCGDMFARDTVLENIFSKEIPDSISFLYSDYLIKTKHRTLRYTASFERGVLLHQSVIYRKSLHERFGFYLITPKIIISDYLFFCLVPVAEVCKVNGIISENDAYGVSSGRWLTAQKLCADVIFRRISMSKLIREWRLTQIKGVVKTIIFYRYWK